MEVKNYPTSSTVDTGETKTPPKKVEKVVMGKASRKKNTVRKLSDSFIKDDISNVRDYLVYDVLIPTIKTTVADMIQNSIDMMLFGEIRRGSSKKRPISDQVSYRYDKCYEGDSDRGRDERRTNRRRIGYSYDDVTVETKREADTILDSLDSIIDRYGRASVADLYDLAGISHEYTDNDYGWTNISSAEIIRVRNEYLIRMPRVIPIK